MNRANALHVLVEMPSPNTCVLKDIYSYNNTPLSPLGIFDPHSQNIDEFALLDYENQIKETSVHSLRGLDIDSIEGSFADNIRNRTDIAISEKNILTGYKTGFIDIINNVLHLESDGWYNKHNEKVCEANASVSELKAYISLSTQILPHLDNEAIREMDNNGIVVFNGNPIAFKSNSSWKFIHNGRQLSGDAMRVLHHSDFSFTYPEDKDDLELYHAVTMSEEHHTKNGNAFHGFIARGNSKQGDCLYLTGSLNEAIRIYGNPESFERKSHAYANKGDHLIHTCQRGVLHKINVSNADIYDASFDNDYSTMHMDSKPSPVLLRTIANKYAIDEQLKGLLLAKTNSMIINSTNQFDVYLAVSEFANSIGDYTGSPDARNIIKQTFSAIGYDGIKVTPPNQNKLNAINEIAQLYREHSINPEKKIVYNNLEISPIVAKHIASYSVKIKGVQIPKMENFHIIMFSPDDALCQIKETITLPKHNKYIESEDNLSQQSDDFYDLDKGSLNKLSFKQIESITNRRDNANGHSHDSELAM